MRARDTDTTSGSLSLRLLPATIAGLLTAISLTVSSCNDKKNEILPGRIDPETVPTMMTRDVNTLISDSGITRYSIEAPVWYVFDESSEPKWTFPEGMHIEKYDNLFRVEATIDCDSAVYFKSKQLWRLDGYVDISNAANERFLTEQLYWDQRREKIYSDSFIHIRRADRIMEGYGFESNQNMTQYRILNVSGSFPVEQFTGEKSDDEAAESTDDSTTVRTAHERTSTRTAATASEPEPELKPVAAPAAPHTTSDRVRRLTDPANGPRRPRDSNDRLLPTNTSKTLEKSK